MAKFDVEAAYRNVPVHRSHCVLLGMKWRDQFYVDLVLPFGLRSAPFIFNSIADMVEWILVNSYQIPHLLHYLDDFITAGPPRSLQCAQNLATAMEVCQRLGLPLHPGKCVGPSTVLTVLGIKLDSSNQASASGRPLWRHAMEYPTTSSKPWAAGQAPLISSISELRPNR